MIPVVFKLRPAEKRAAGLRAKEKGDSLSAYVRSLVRADLERARNGRAE